MHCYIVGICFHGKIYNFIHKSTFVFWCMKSKVRYNGFIQLVLNLNVLCRRVYLNMQLSLNRREWKQIHYINIILIRFAIKLESNDKHVNICFVGTLFFVKLVGENDNIRKWLRLGTIIKSVKLNENKRTV